MNHKDNNQNQTPNNKEMSKQSQNFSVNKSLLALANDKLVLGKTIGGKHYNGDALILIAK